MVSEAFKKGMLKLKYNDMSEPRLWLIQKKQIATKWGILN